MTTAKPALAAESPTTDHLLQPGVLVRQAAHGDRRAWEALVNAYSGVICAVTRQFRLGEADAADVAQTTWLRLLEHVDRLNDPTRVGSWLATTARRECLRTLAQRRRIVLTGDHHDFEHTPDPVAEVDASLLAEERCEDVDAALAQLPQRWRAIITLLTADPPTPYEEISARLQVPIGSIGPTRRRCLRRLQELIDP